MAVLDVAEEETSRLDLVPFASGWLVSADPVDAESMLMAQMQLRRQDEVQLLRRRPRRLVPLRWDDLLQSYLECERLQLGEQSIVLCHGQIESPVSAFLQRAARPGFSSSKDLPGLPDGWTLFTGVQILSSQDAPLVDLQALQPLADSRVVLQGGLKLPGHLPKWLTARPPELRASAQEGASLEARLVCTRPMADPAPPDARHQGAGSVLIWDLGEARLSDGDYELTVLADGDRIGVELLRLRSGDNPAPQFNGAEEAIRHDPAAPGFGLLASRSSDPAGFGVAPVGEGRLTPGTLPSRPAWWDARAVSPSGSTSAKVVSFPQGGHSCIETGAHYIDVATAAGGEQTVEGVCRYCGLVKRYPASYRRARRSAPRRAPVVAVDELPPLRAEAAVDWSVAFDAVCHVGGGNASALERIAAQMEATDLFGDAFARTLETCGHLEIERDRRSLRQLAWRVNDPTVIGLPDGDAVLVGFRSERALVAVEDEVWASGGQLTEEAASAGPPVVRVSSVDREGLHRLAKVVAAAVDRPARYLPDAATRLAACLPPLSEAARGLPSSSALSARSYERWDPRAARFERAADASAAGAFRLNGPARLYVYRRAGDIGTMSAVLGDARIVKHLAALDARLPLAGYDPDEQVLYVPLGADLPGLYGRAAVLASGQPPEVDTEQHLLAYRRVPPALAAHLARLLSS